MLLLAGNAAFGADTSQPTVGSSTAKEGSVRVDRELSSRRVEITARCVFAPSRHLLILGNRSRLPERETFPAAVSGANRFTIARGWKKEKVQAHEGENEDRSIGESA